MKICRNCGSILEETATACENCGLALNGIYSKIKNSSSGPLYEVNIDNYLRTAWKIFKMYPWGFIGFTFIGALLVILTLALEIYSQLLGFVVEVGIFPISTGILFVTAKLLQQQSCTFKDFFLWFRYYKPLVILGLLYGIIGKIDNIIPHESAADILTLVALLMMSTILFFTPMLIIDRRLDCWEAMKKSWRVAQRRLLQILWLNILFFFIFIGGIIALGVGIFITYPLVACAEAVAYAEIFGLQSNDY